MERMERTMHIAIIGAGAMGTAIIEGLLQREVVPPSQIVASEPRDERRDELRTRYGIEVSSDNVEAAHRGHVVLFAVKPQLLPQVLPPLRGVLPSDALCLSIAAGVPIATFTDSLNHAAVVRAMPNTPAQIGEGMTVWAASPEVTAEQRAWAQQVLGALGCARYVEHEGYLDMATAINGSGPAYIFLMLEAMIDAGVHMGFTRPMAQELVYQTMLGAVRYAQHSGAHPAELRNAVTSPAGTTAAALSELERGNIRTVLSEAIWAAYRRSCELGSSKKT
jgi:pyrroline-5-carboxylate reductase